MTADEQLVADTLAHIAAVQGPDVQILVGDLLAELPIADAAAYLREQSLRSLSRVQQSGFRAAEELTIMVRFWRLCQLRPSLHRLHYPEGSQ